MKQAETRHARTNGWVVLVPIMAIVALLAFGIGSASTKTRLYFFDKTGRNLVEERRTIPLVGSIETRAVALLEEYLLGPAEHGHIGIMPPGTRILAVLHRRNRLTVSLETQALYGFKLDFSKVREALEKTLASGIPGYGMLELHVNGQQTLK